MADDLVTIGPAPVDALADQVMVPSRDGVRLATDVYLPAGNRHPAVLVRLPYDKCGRYTFMPQLAPWFTDFATQRLLVEVFTVFAIALAWNLLAGYGGLVVVGHQMFVGVGAYALFALSNKLEINPWLMLPLAAVNVNDRFATRNQFYGAQVGAEAVYCWGRWSGGIRGKVALGDSHQ